MSPAEILTQSPALIEYGARESVRGYFGLPQGVDIRTALEGWTRTSDLSGGEAYSTWNQAHCHIAPFSEEEHPFAAVLQREAQALSELGLTWEHVQELVDRFIAGKADMMLRLHIYDNDVELMTSIHLPGPLEAGKLLSSPVAVLAAPKGTVDATIKETARNQLQRQLDEAYARVFQLLSTKQHTGAQRLSLVAQFAALQQIPERLNALIGVKKTKGA